MPRLRFLLAALVFLPLAACDQSDPGSSVEESIDDAQIARANGDYDTAITILEDALEKEPENPEVRVELSGTLLEKADVDVVVLDDIAQFLTSPAGARRGGGDARMAEAGCSFASDQGAAPFDLDQAPGFATLLEYAPTIRAAQEYIGPVIPSEIQNFDVCTNIVDGELVYDRDGALQQLRDKGFTANLESVLGINGLSQFIASYIAFTEATEGNTDWYRLSDGSLGVCTDDPAAFKANATSAASTTGRALLSMDARASVLGNSSGSRAVVDYGLDAYQSFESTIGQYCDDQ